MKFILEIDCDGIAKDELRRTVGEIVANVAYDILELTALSGEALDAEDNPVGSWRFIATPAHDSDGVSA